MEKFKNVCNKIGDVLSWIIGYTLMICLFVGGLGVIGYLVALCIGGDTATAMCTWIYKTFYVWLIKISTWTTVACFILAYLKGEANWINPIKYWKKQIENKKSKKHPKQAEIVLEQDGQATEENIQGEQEDK